MIWVVALSERTRLPQPADKDYYGKAAPHLHSYALDRHRIYAGDCRHFWSRSPEEETRCLYHGFRGRVPG